MILDHLSRSEKYYNVHSSFRHAFDYVKQHNLAALSDGKYEVEGSDIYIILSHGHAADTPPQLENHRKYIDIQIALDGTFPLGWKAVDHCTDIATGYNDGNDVQHYNDRPEFTVNLTDGMFAIVFPEDAHAGLPPSTSVRKAVVKVAV